MATPTPQEVIDALQKLKLLIEDFFAELEAKSPAGLVGSEEELKQALEAVVDTFDLPALVGSIEEVLAVFRNLKGPDGPGLDADEAGP